MQHGAVGLGEMEAGRRPLGRAQSLGRVGLCEAGEGRASEEWSLCPKHHLGSQH